MRVPADFFSTILRNLSVWLCKASRPRTTGPHNVGDSFGVSNEHPRSRRLDKRGLPVTIPRSDGIAFLFGPGAKIMSPQSMQKAFERAVKGGNWEVMRGWHVLRHSFISALASRGVHQRLIDEFVGHQTEDQRRRYRYLYPPTQQQAILGVFG
jgi:integrase